jgi:hypothetical protein
MLIAPAGLNAADTEPAKVTATAIRAQGMACAEPVTAQRDPAASKPDEPVWLVACSDGRYRVRLMGEAKPRIERLP